MARRWTMYTATSAGVRTGQIRYFRSARYVARANEVGTFALDGLTLTDRPVTDLLNGTATRIEFAVANPDDDDQAETVTFVGLIDQRSRQVTALGDEVTIIGRDLMAVLAERVCYYDPTTVPSPSWPAAGDARGPDNSTTLAHGFIDDNAGPSALAERQTPGLLLGADIEAGRSDAELAGLGQPVLDAVRELLEPDQLIVYADGYTIRIADPSANDSTNVILDPAAGAANAVTYAHTTPAATVVIARKDDGGLTFATVQNVDATLKHRRIEQWADAGADTALTDVALAALPPDEGDTAAVDARDLAQFEYPWHYNIGTRVSVPGRDGSVAPADLIALAVYEVAVTITGDADAVRPGLGIGASVTPPDPTRVASRGPTGGGSTGGGGTVGTVDAADIDTGTVDAPAPPPTYRPLERLRRNLIALLTRGRS